MFDSGDKILRFLVDVYTERDANVELSDAKALHSGPR
jgi:hypothetical protein